MKKVLFYTFIGIFIATALLTLLGIAGSVPIDEAYLSKLFYLLIVELIASVVGLFRTTNFFAEDDPQSAGSNLSKVNVLMLPKTSFPRAGDPHKCKITIYNPDSDNEREIKIAPIRSNGHLSTFLDKVDEKELIKVEVTNVSQETWESEYFAPTLAKAELVKL